MRVENDLNEQSPYDLKVTEGEKVMTELQRRC